MDYENKSPKKKKFSLYNIFNPQGNGQGIEKIPEGPDNIGKCFKLIGRHITNLFYLNLMLIFGNFPIFSFLLAYNMMIPTTAASSALYGPVNGIAQFTGSNPFINALLSIHGFQVATNAPTTLYYVFLALTCLVVFTFGPVNTGVTYIMRAMIRGQHFSLIRDFFGAIKKNWKQALIMGILDCALIALLVYDIYFFYLNHSALMYVNLLLLCFYFIMRYYIYLLLITFDLSIWKIIKNSLIFIMLNFKRNLIAFSGTAAACILEYLVLSVFVPLGIIFPFVLLFSVPMFFGAFAAYTKIKEIMIDPQVQETA
ncbi:MAG: DUF624 domain-containing protein [Clostridia bacterium]|nr:DUF624 domain-containing protein [Clostridia bacterium]